MGALLTALLVGVLAIGVWGLSLVAMYRLGVQDGRKREQVAMARAMATLRKHYATPGDVGTSELCSGQVAHVTVGPPMDAKGNVVPDYNETPEEEAERLLDPEELCSVPLACDCDTRAGEGCGVCCPEGLWHARTAAPGSDLDAHVQGWRRFCRAAAEPVDPAGWPVDRMDHAGNKTTAEEWCEMRGTTMEEMAEAQEAHEENDGTSDPIGRCRACGTPVYTVPGYCARCEP